MTRIGAKELPIAFVLESLLVKGMAVWRGTELAPLWPAWCWRSRDEALRNNMKFTFPWWLLSVPGAHHWGMDAQLHVAIPAWPVAVAWYWWQWRRWCLEWWGCRHGWFLLSEEGGMYTRGRWTLQRRKWWGRPGLKWAVTIGEWEACADDYR